MKVITLVRGVVPAERREEFESAYASVKNESLPQGLETSYLLRQADGSGLYCIESIWSSPGALQAMRSKERPKAIVLFEIVGVSPTVEIHEIVDVVQ